MTRRCLPVLNKVSNITCHIFLFSTVDARFSGGEYCQLMQVVRIRALNPRRSGERRVNRRLKAREREIASGGLAQVGRRPICLFLTSTASFCALGSADNVPWAWGFAVKMQWAGFVNYIFIKVNVGLPGCENAKTHGVEEGLFEEGQKRSLMTPSWRGWGIVFPSPSSRGPAATRELPERSRVLLP